MDTNCQNSLDLLKPFFSKFVILGKTAVIFFLFLIILIPMSSLDSTLRERLERRNGVVSEINSTWGPDQHVVGPVLILPFKQWYTTYKDEPLEKGGCRRVEVTDFRMQTAYFLPEELNVTGTLEPKKLYRTIYETVVYTAKIKLSGQFKICLEKLKIKPEDAMLQDAVMTIAIADLRGTNDTIKVKWGEEDSLFMPGCPWETYGSGISAPIKIKTDMLNKDILYEIELNFHGSERVTFAPMGVKNNVKLSSSWPDPSFCGAFLPTDRKVTANGFEASWLVTYYGRNYPQQWTSQNVCDRSLFNNSLFGVALLMVVDSYRCVERSINYCSLFIGVILAVFFLFEILCSLKIHPFEYLLVGAALALFYLLLLAISEFLPFVLAYSIGASVACLLITLYSLAILKSGKRTLLVLFGLIMNYGFLYFILQMQDYSLLAGSILLSLLLAIIMYVTRKIDWYKPGANCHS